MNWDVLISLIMDNAQHDRHKAYGMAHMLCLVAIQVEAPVPIQIRLDKLRTSLTP